MDRRAQSLGRPDCTAWLHEKPGDPAATLPLYQLQADWRREHESNLTEHARTIEEWELAKSAGTLLSAPDITTVRGLRDRAILAVLLGCGLRRSEVAALTFNHLQQRDGRWCIVDLVGKHGRPGAF